MLDLNVTFFALAIPAVIFSGVSKGGFGSGASFAAAPILAMILPPALAIGVMLPVLMAIDVATLGPYWRKWDSRIALLLILGALPGVILGALIFKSADPDLLRLLIGGIAVAFVLWQGAVARGWIRPRQRPFGDVAGALFGATGGFTSFVSHAGGPPITIYLLSSGLSKTAFQATTVLVFWAINLTKAVPYAMLGLFTREALIAAALLIPFAVFGARIGVWAHRIVPERLFFGLTYAMLLLTGSKLIFDALT